MNPTLILYVAGGFFLAALFALACWGFYRLFKRPRRAKPLPSARTTLTFPTRDELDLGGRLVARQFREWKRQQEEAEADAAELFRMRFGTVPAAPAK